MAFQYNPLTGKLDFVNNRISGTVIFKGTITTSSDFPTTAVVQNGDSYFVNATVTDNNPSKTNTGQSFVSGDEIAWNGTDWTNLGNATSILATTNTWTGSNTFSNTVNFSGLTASRALVLDASKNITTSSVTTTELGYLSGVTSALQTQLDGKQATGNYITGLSGEATASGPGVASVTLSNSAVIAKVLTEFTSRSGALSATDSILQAIQKLDGNIGLRALASGYTANRVLISDGSGSLTTSTTSTTQVQYLSSTTGTTGTTSSNIVFSASPVLTGIVSLNTLQASGSGGITIKSNGGTDVALLGAGGGAGTTFYGGINGTDAAFSGRIRITGNSSTPSFSTDAYVWRTNSNGLVLGGVGATNDIFIVNGSGSNVARVATGSTNFRFYSAIEPSSNDGAALGTTSRSWSDVFVASGGVINFNNGDYTITHSTGTLSFSGDILLTKTGITSILTNTLDGSDSKAITMGGGGAYNVNRGSGIALIGNEYATVGGDLELLAGDSAISGAIRFYVGDGAGGARLAGRIERTTGAFHIGTSGTNTGTLIFNGATSGGVTMKSANAAGTWTMTLPTSAGTSGQVLSTDGSGNTSWATVSSGTSYPEYIPANVSTNYIWYSDNTGMMAIADSGLTQLCLSNAASVDSTTAGTSQNMRYLNGTAQTVAITTIWADADAITGLIIREGYVYVSLNDTGVANRIYRCAVTSDITAGGNWTQLTISGTALQTSGTAGIVGYGDGKFWVIHTTNGFIPYTLSGTTLTSGTAVTVTGSTYDSSICRVNGLGIYAYFGSAPFIRFASFAGTLDGTKQVSTPQNWCFVFDGASYTKTGSNWSKLNF